MNFIKSNQFNALQTFETTNKYIPTNNLLNLTEKQKTGDKLVLYYTNWCGISRQFKPIWDKFCQETKTGIITEEINCENNNNKCNLMNIKGYPTIILHKTDGQNIEFRQERTVQSLENFVNKYKS